MLKLHGIQQQANVHLVPRSTVKFGLPSRDRFLFQSVGCRESLSVGSEATVIVTARRPSSRRRMALSSVVT